MPFNAQRERRLLEAARRDGDEGRYFDDLDQALERGEMRPADFSMREVFTNFVEDGHEIVSSWSPRHGGGSTGVQLLENAVNTGAFANITGQIVYTTVIETFNDPVFIAPQLARTNPTEFDGEKIPGVAQIGDEAETIGEGQPYPMAGVGEEWIETPATTKRGFIVPVTKEAIFFDRTSLVLQRARDVSKWLAVNKEKRVIDAALGITSSYRRNGAAAVASYGDNSGAHDWDNLAASNALQDWTDIENALLLFDDLTDPNTGEPILVHPNTLVVPTALSFTAQRIVGATELREVTNTNTTTISANPLSGQRTGGSNGAPFTVLSNQYVKSRTGSATTWFIGDFMEAFAYMENWPITAVDAPPNSEMEFTHDIVFRSKVSERGVPAAIEPRKAVKATA